MAKRYPLFSFGTGESEGVSQLKKYLIDYYGSSNLTFYYQTTTILVVKIEAVFSKVLAFSLPYQDVEIKYGDSWVSAFNLSNSKTICTDGSQNTLRPVGAFVILDAEFIALHFNTVLGGLERSEVFLAGTLNNGDEIAFASCFSSYASYATVCKGYRVSDSAIVDFLQAPGASRTANPIGKIILSEFYFALRGVNPIFNGIELAKFSNVKAVLCAKMNILNDSIHLTQPSVLYKDGQNDVTRGYAFLLNQAEGGNI